jgi:REase_DpnII-MboI
MAAADIFDTLIAETRDLDSAAGSVQGEHELLATPEGIEALISAYQDWYARALGVLPQEFHEKFVDLFEGGLVVKRIKSFLEGPGRVSAMFTAESANLFPYWEHPFETTFHSSLLEQRQVLTLAKQVVQRDASIADLDLVERLGRGLPSLIESLTHRHAGRDPLVISDEYDVQDLLTGVLRMIFEDVRVEDPSPAHAGGSSRLDFVLKRQRIIVEVKMTRAGLRDRDLGKQLIEDIERYRSHPDGDALVAIVYDPDRNIRNPRGLESDLERDHGGLVVRVVVTG